MKNILLICSAGVTSATLVAEMKNSKLSKKFDLSIKSAGVAEIKKEISNADIVLLSPQSAYLKDTLKDLINDKTELKILPSDIYLKMDGNAVINYALNS